MFVFSKFYFSCEIETYSHWGGIKKELYKLNNFHAVAGFIVGLNMAPISRLKHSLNELGKKRKAILQLLNEFMNPASSYLSYRNTLHSRTTPAVPFM